MKTIKKYSFVFLTVLLMGCRGAFWNQKLKEEATDYAAGQKYELVTEVEFDGSINSAGRLNPQNEKSITSVILKGTTLEISKVEFQNNIEAGRTIIPYAKILSGRFVGKEIRLFGISLHRRPGDTSKWVNSMSYSFADPKILKRIE